ncbi:unnamed protein product, partial [Mesorhabditis spiculigera]
MDRGRAMTTITKPWDDVVDKNVVLRFIDTNLKGSGQVMFQGNALTGLLFLVGIFWGAIAADTITVAIGAVVGLVVSTVTGMMLHLTTIRCVSACTDTTEFCGSCISDVPCRGRDAVDLPRGGSCRVDHRVPGCRQCLKTWGVPALTFRQPPPASFPSTSGDASVHADITFNFLWDTLFRNVSQIFLINNTVTGIIFVIALLSFVYTVFGALVTVVIHGTLVSAFAPISLPAGTGPFVFATWLFLLPKKKFVPIQHDTIEGGAGRRQGFDRKGERLSMVCQTSVASRSRLAKSGKARSVHLVHHGHIATRLGSRRKGNDNSVYYAEFVLEIACDGP